MAAESVGLSLRLPRGLIWDDGAESFDVVVVVVAALAFPFSNVAAASSENPVVESVHTAASSSFSSCERSVSIVIFDDVEGLKGGGLRFGSTGDNGFVFVFGVVGDMATSGLGMAPVMVVVVTNDACVVGEAKSRV